MYYTIYIHAITKDAWPLYIDYFCTFSKGNVSDFFCDNLMKLSYSFHWLLKNVILNFGTFLAPRSEVVSVRRRLNAQKHVFVDNLVIFWDADLKCFGQKTYDYIITNKLWNEIIENRKYFYVT